MKKFLGQILVAAMFLVLGLSAGTVYADDASDIKNPVYNEDIDSTVWDYIYFGSYPQSKLRTSQLTDAILKAEYNNNGDAVVGGQRYRRLLVGNSYQYFQYEPIKWRVLENKDGYFLLMADNILECEVKSSYNAYEYDSKYESSVLRSFLNAYKKNYNEEHIDCSVKGTNFINVAFSEDEIAVLDEPYSDSSDLVMVPTESVLVSEKYGFNPLFDVGEESYTRTMGISDYARSKERDDIIQYAFMNSDDNIGGISAEYGIVASQAICELSIVPLIKINADSDLWSKQAVGKTVTQKNINTIEYDLESTSFTYSGSEIKPKVSMYDNGVILNEGIDYRTSYTNCINAGKAKVTVRGLNDYSGIISIQYTINKAEQKISVPASLTKEYNLAGINIGAKRTKGNGKLSYKLSSTSITTVTRTGTLKPKKTGKVTVTITAAETSNYKKAVAKTVVTITKANIKSANVKLAKKLYFYDGKAKKPAVKSVILNEVKLKKNRDYTISYKKNKNVGTATVTIKGKGNYKGAAKATFEIDLKNGKVYKAGDYKYKVVYDAVMCVGFSGKQKSDVIIPDTVKIGGYKIKVCAIGKKAFMGCNKITKVNFGKNIEYIETRAFMNCKNLIAVIFEGNPYDVTICDKAFSGVHPDCVVYRYRR